jgi:hypothetical protein
MYFGCDGLGITCDVTSKGPNLMGPIRGIISSVVPVVDRPSSCVVRPDLPWLGDCVVIAGRGWLVDNYIHMLNVYSLHLSPLV